MRSRYKKFKEAEFFNELTQSLRVYLLFCKYYREVVLLLKFSIQKIQRGGIFLLEMTGFVVGVLDTKNSKRQNFFTRTDRFLLLEFSIQKNQRGRIF